MKSPPVMKYGYVVGEKTRMCDPVLVSPIIIQSTIIDAILEWCGRTTPTQTQTPTTDLAEVAHSCLYSAIQKKVDAGEERESALSFNIPTPEDFEHNTSFQITNFSNCPEWENWFMFRVACFM